MAQAQPIVPLSLFCNGLVAAWQVGSSRSSRPTQISHFILNFSKYCTPPALIGHPPSIHIPKAEWNLSWAFLLGQSPPSGLRFRNITDYPQRA